MSHIVGILNLTPDSFSDGGEFSAPDHAMRRIAQMFEQGAKIVDIGAESTRPGAVALSAEEEWARLAPLLNPALREWKKSLSIDTRHPETAKRALAMGAAWINDVSGGNCYLEVKHYPDARYILMHALGVPADTSVTLKQQDDPVEEVMTFFVSRLAVMDVPETQIILDPGIGFGKTAEQSWQLMRRAGEFRELDLPLLFGHSRKSCFKSLAADPRQRDGATLAASLHLARQGVEYLRVHDVALHAQALAAERLLHV